MKRGRLTCGEVVALGAFFAVLMLIAAVLYRLQK